MNNPIKPTIDTLKQQYRQSSLPVHWWQSWLLFVINQPRSFLITDGAYLLSDDEYLAFLVGIERMLAGEPLAYLLGVQAFWGRDFVVNRHTLIPRADTEILVQAVLDFVKDGLKPCRILDLGTGSGCVAITLAKELPNACVVAVDNSMEAIAVAKQNAQRLHATNCQIQYSNWFDSLSSVFDVIISNPPYIAKTDTHLLALSAEPMTALVADDDGLSDIKIIIAGAKNHLNKGGLLAIEHGFDQGKKVRLLFDDAGFVNVETIKDYGGNDRVTIGVKRD